MTLSITTPLATPTYTFELDVHVFDTDCYGVMWHGAYTKWLEMGRVDCLRERGILLSPPNDPEGYVYPVVEQQFRFRSPAKLNDRLRLTTDVTVEKHKLIFNQAFYQTKDDKIVMTAQTTCLVLDANWKPFRQLPQKLLEKLTA